MADEAIYRTVWRWHFYAGLMVLPVLLWLAVTGALYLYKPEIEGIVYRDWSAASGPPIAIAPMVAQVEKASGARVASLSRPADPAASWRMTLTAADGTRRLAFVDPATGRVLGEARDGGVMGFVRSLHSLIIAGPVGNAVVEIVAGWAILLVLSGAYLWWPRGTNRALALRGRPAGRLFWRDLHASTGAIAGAVILFLALTGMPWSGIWGKGLQTAVATYGLGRPPSPGPSPWQRGKGHDGHMAAAKAALPWAMQEAAAPAGHKGHDIGADRAVAIAVARGLTTPWLLVLPAEPGNPYLVTSVIEQAQDARAIYVDAVDGRVLADMRYAGFGIGARTIEWGIAVHQGQQYGEVNRLIMLAGCIAIMLLAISAPMLWWKRRRNGRLEAPPRAVNPNRARGVAAIMLAVGALFPLTGVTMVVALLIDRLWLRGRWRTE